jgi:outer membrane protein assembly factor BamB
MTPAPIRTVVVVISFLAACGKAGNPSSPGNPQDAFAQSAPASPKQPVGWRNDGSGRYPLATPPLEWSDTKNILWTTKIGPNKYSSPVVVEGRIFVVADPAWLCCVNAADGSILWKKSNGFDDLPDKVEGKRPPGDAGNTTPTPASDGQFVYAVFGSGIVASYDLKGERQWIQHFNLKCATEYGRAASPLLAGGKLIVTLSYLLALDPMTGKEVWKNKDVPELYGTPIAATIGGVEVLVMPSGQIVRLQDGKILAADLGGLKFASPIVQDGTVYLIQAGSSAQRFSAPAPDKWEAKQLWDQELEGIFYASALFDKGLIYAVANENKFNILDAKDGKILASRDLEIPDASGRPADMPANMYSSLALAGNYLFMLNDRGDTLVLDPGRQYKELKRNHLSDAHGGTPAFDGKRIYIRGSQNLYCIGEK